MRKIFTALIALSVALQPVQAASPSFDCTTNRSLLERLICSDPELSKLDAEMNGAYWTAVRRAGQKNAHALRADQRAFNQHRLYGVEYRLNYASLDAAPQSGAGDAQDHVYGREAAIGALKWRITERIKVLIAFEPVRDGYEGQWRSQSGQLQIKKRQRVSRCRLPPAPSTGRASGARWMEPAIWKAPAWLLMPSA